MKLLTRAAFYEMDTAGKVLTVGVSAGAAARNIDVGRVGFPQLARLSLGIEAHGH